MAASDRCSLNRGDPISRSDCNAISQLYNTVGELFRCFEVNNTYMIITQYENMILFNISITALYLCFDEPMF